eukprot:3108130-Rhodomonas_salina.1
MREHHTDFTAPSESVLPRADRNVSREEVAERAAAGAAALAAARGPSADSHEFCKCTRMVGRPGLALSNALRVRLEAGIPHDGTDF